MVSDVTPALRAAIGHHAEGRLAEAETRYREVLAAQPDHARAAHLLGVLLLQAGALDEAAELLGRAARLTPQSAEAQNNYGVALRRLGRLADAVEAFRAAVHERPDLFDAQNNLAETLLAVDDTDAALEAARVAHALAPEHPGPLLAMGVVHFQRGHYAPAAEGLAAALALAPGDARAATLLHLARGRQVQPWHFAMLNEHARNDAYDAALRRAVAPGALVLEIGTGSGLLAMAAARAGAGHVVGCEMVTVLADKAREIIARNGYADRITVYDKRSTELRVGVELPTRAPVLVSELFDSNLLGEGVLASLEDAHARLLAPGAAVIPRAASAMVELAGGEALGRAIRVEKCAGFDMAPMNEYTPERIVFDGGRVDYESFSEPFEALRFDFRHAHYPPRQQTVETTVTRSGLCFGVVQWLRIELDEVSSYENRPRASTGYISPWLPTLYTFEQPVLLEAGEAFALTAAYGHESLVFRAATLRA